jgi:hypothetical protein
MGDHFSRKLWQGTAPLVLWAAHFFFCYLYAGSGCRPETWGVLAGVTLLALGAAGWLAWQGWRAGGRRRGVLAMAQRGGALLALVAIAWGALPLLAFGDCA